MWIYQIRLAFRNFFRNKVYTLVNVFGLSMGITITLLILLWTFDELSTNKFHEDLDQIYLVRTRQFYGSTMENGSGTAPALSPVVKEEYPEVLNSGRIQNSSEQLLFQCGDKNLYQSLQLADPEIFDVFTFPLLSGNLEEVKHNDHVLILSESVSKKFFGKEDPLGKIINIDKQLFTH